jgi:glycogen debranching enzyme
MRTQSVSILEGNTFVVSDLRGDVDASPNEPQGLFHWDTRFLSRWKLSVDDRVLNVLTTDDLQYFSAQFFMVPGTGTIYTDANWSLIRKRAVGDGFHEDLTVMNHASEPLGLRLRLEAASDFADLFEVKDALTKKGEIYSSVQDGHLVLGYRRENFVRETWITATATEAVFDEHGISFNINVAPHGNWTSCIEVVTARDGSLTDKTHAKYGHGADAGNPNIGMSLAEQAATVPRLTSDWNGLEATYWRSIVDLAALRFFPQVLPGHSIPAAGLPWFMTIFGRDSIISSLQALPFSPQLAHATLRILATRQGKRVDPFRDEEPGKILHEQRYGELTAFEERPHSPYYGSADATPLFLVLLDEYERWTGDSNLVRELAPAARRALVWIDEYGDRDGDGYVEYERRNTETGLENQCWKDSPDSIQFADGSVASLPRATCEIQGYTYDAKRRCARLARWFWDDPVLADRLEREAAELKARFNRDFWLADRGYFAVALDGRKRPADSLTSNIGHLLWSGIVDDDKVPLVVEKLMSDRLFSGWGVRTLAASEGGYNPIGYHLGTVWPHDNSLIALGLSQLGYRDEATRVATGILEAANYFEHRLPEAFAGYPRAFTGFPVEYPTACSPQAWATGAPLLMVRVLLGMEPNVRGLQVAPSLPKHISRIDITRLPWRGDRLDVSSRRPTPLAVNGQAGVFDSAASSARDYFEHLEQQVDSARLVGLSVRSCFQIPDVGTWRVTVVEGLPRVDELRSPSGADTVVTVSEPDLLRLIRGEQNPTTAFLRGAVKVSGDLAAAERVVNALFAPRQS